MKKSFILLFSILSFSLFAQENLSKEAQAIVEEGKILYRSEMASWYGTDLFLEKYKNQNNIGGYFSYADGKVTKCIFVSKTEKPVVIGTISFDENFSVKTAKCDLKEREFTNLESDLFDLRSKTKEIVNSDDMFKTYKNTNFNIIPLINGKEKKVYILTGTTEQKKVIFGNDYLLTFNSKNKLQEKKKLHNNIIPVSYGGKDEVGSIHSHLPETGDYITATDICTIMLYEKFTKWETYQVVTEKFINIWSCDTNTLIVIPNKSFKSIQESEEKKKNEKDKD